MPQHQQQQQQRVKKIQQKIKNMIKNKKMHKLNSQKDIALSQKPITIQNQKLNNKLDDIKSLKTNKFQINQQEQKDSSQQNTKTYSYKRMKSTMAEIQPMSSGSLYQGEKRFTVNKNVKDQQNQNQLDQKTPSLQKLVKLKQKISKRPSSVMNKSNRPPTSRTKLKKTQQPTQKKQLDEKLRICIDKAFTYGIKLQKYSQERKINLQLQKQKLFNQEINILKLINQCKKIVIQKSQNEQELEDKLISCAERQIIQLLKKKKQKQKIINSCQRITNQISNLIQSRLNALTRSQLVRQ